MPLPNPDDYYIRRAEQSRQLAEAATSPEARMIHEEMVTLYNRLAGSEPSPGPRLRPAG